MADEVNVEQLQRILVTHAGFRHVRERVGQLVGSPTWWLALPPEQPFWLLRSDQEEQNGAPIGQHRFCLVAMRRAAARCRTSLRPEVFSSSRSSGLAAPLLSHGAMIGGVACCHMARTPSQETLADLALALELVIGGALKEAELDEMNQTVKPRAIALSTVHTVHRLLSATLDLDELLPKMARLCTQILRSRCCSIRLLDERQYLVPKAMVDLSADHAGGGRRLKVGRGVEGWVAKTGNVYFHPRKICVPLVETEVMGTITVSSRGDRPPYTVADREILTTLTEQAVIAIRNAQLYAEQEKLTFGSIQALSSMLDAKSPSTYTHSRGCVELTLAIADQMRLSPEEIRALHFAALLPETGKVGVPESVLLKPTPLTGEERKMLRQRPMRGARIIQSIKMLKPAVPILLYHHERYDGSGYPKGLKREEIPIGARIFAVAEAFDAMVGKRPYRKRMTVEQAITEIQHSSGTQFDGAVVRAFLRVTRQARFRAIVRHMNRGPAPVAP